MSAILLIAAALVAAETDVSDVSTGIAAAHEHRQCGRYEEALEAYAALAEQSLDAAQRSEVLIGRSVVREETGEWQAATDELRVAVEQQADAALWARLAELEYRQGRYDAAALAVDAALKMNANSAAAHVIQGHLLRETGEFEKAIAEYNWCVKYFNRAQPKDAETLLALAEGSLEYARWKRASNIFNFVVNTLCPEALKDDPRCWQAYALSGGLLLEKYNAAQAETELNRGLAINPSSADILTLLGKLSLSDLKVERAEELAGRALDVNPLCLDALLLKADLRLSVGDPPAAREFITQALAVNPADQRIRAREAVCCLLEDGMPPEAELLELFLHLDAIADFDATNSSRFATILADIAKANPRPGAFLSIVGEALDAQRLFAAAELFYRQSIVVMPQLGAPRANLGMLYMRTGRIEEAGKILDDAFKLDPFHVRVSNMRKVVDVLEGYETVSTDHFLLKCDKADGLLAKLMSRKLEGFYAELTERYGFEPPARTPFELYASAEGQSAHEWFSARMVGLPWIQTIGASTGMIVALASPTHREPYNWAQVVRHEFVHILTLQKTNFQIPHWYTEALAVREEGTAMPDEWQELLLNRAPRGELFNLANLNAGFQRPRDGDDWTLAYCQSALYARYMVERFGDDALTKLLDAYCTTRDTPEAIEQTFGVGIDDFETGYAAFVARLVAEIQSQRAPRRPTLAEAEAAHAADPANLDAAGRYALALQRNEKYRSARELAETVNAEQPSQPEAALVLAGVALSQNYEEQAVELLVPAIDESAPHAGALSLLARLRYESEDMTEAARLYELGTQKFPLEDRFWNGLALSLWKSEDLPRLASVLETVAARDTSNAAVRKRLSQVARDAGRLEDAVRWGEDALCIDIEDVEVHKLLAGCYEQLGDAAAAEDARQAVLELGDESGEPKTESGE
ncbi:MAG: tetratricopeptide repeat protein [Planctomycetaceae bacterium]|nr:tetratricopeptide repeat protein [Planctomycetaceae bacterium]